MSLEVEYQKIIHRKRDDDFFCEITGIIYYCMRCGQCKEYDESAER